MKVNIINMKYTIKRFRRTIALAGVGVCLGLIFFFYILHMKISIIDLRFTHLNIINMKQTLNDFLNFLETSIYFSNLTLCDCLILHGICTLKIYFIFSNFINSQVVFKKMNKKEQAINDKPLKEKNTLV